MVSEIQKSVSEVIQDVCDDICNNYCKYPQTYKPEENQGIELWESSICENCPLNRLI